VYDTVEGGSMRYAETSIPLAVLVLLSLSSPAAAGDGAGDAGEPPSDEMTFHQDLAWSPDGSRIAFSARTVSRARWEQEKYGALDGADYEVYVMDADGSHRRQLTDNAFDDVWLSWSPDGSRLAFSSDREGSRDLYAMSADGSGVTRLTSDEGDESAPSWSPDGARIAFMSKQGDHWRLRIVDADGSEERDLAPNAADAYNPVWSPDGSRLAYYASPGGPGNDHVFVVSVDGTAPPEAVAKGIYPAWSPDGRSLIYADEHVLHAVDADGSNPRVLAEGAFFGRYSPDGRRIAVVTGEFPDTKIVVMNVADAGPPEPRP
jgi:Tol biopolymer transport system component